MADNVAITAGAGTDIATDQLAGGQHVQLVKLLDGTADSATPILAGGGVEAGALRVTVASDSTGVLSIDDGGNVITVDGTVTANLSATDNTVLDSIQTAVEVIDNCISGSEAQCDVVSMPTGASAAQVQGTVAHDSAAANNPVLLGGTAANAAPAAVANADVVRLIADLNGRLVVAPYATPEKFEYYASSADIVDQADDEVFAAVASTSHYITQFTATCSHATTGTYVVLKDNDTVCFVGYCAPAGGGFAVSFPVPIKCASGVHVNVANVTDASATRVSVSGYQAP